MQNDSVVVAAIQAALDLAKLSIGRDNESRKPEALTEHFKKHYAEIINVIKSNPINSGNQPQ